MRSVRQAFVVLLLPASANTGSLKLNCAPKFSVLVLQIPSHSFDARWTLRTARTRPRNSRDRVSDKPTVFICGVRQRLKRS